ncbi:uncharacterized protein FIBRA_08548 [Fibroporia radiculosa]|uniref:non-specific serine/threonine protein kinase n=1 Tax=Fibroporia radiculosa TaxID=599839 RepID=J4I2X8_9APHY|nr:uncharacterized protein FIBRA_08548 [Fibroporia radiculosa]CCM06297.1 predicted protein [Fibroporia radiculosa]
MTTTAQTGYRPFQLDGAEDLERYCPGGFHPVSIGDILAGSRYKVVHKLGFGGSSTVWLVQEQSLRGHSQDLGGPLAVKILSAERSSKSGPAIAELCIPQELDRVSRTAHYQGREHILFPRDGFMQEGPNGSHICIVSPLAGPSILSLAECPGRVSGSRRLRGDLARKVARQVVLAVQFLHSRGIVHGDLTSANVVFRLSDAVRKWSADDVYNMLGNPETEEVVTRDGSPPDPHAPPEVVSPIDSASLHCSKRTSS